MRLPSRLCVLTGLLLAITACSTSERASRAAPASAGLAGTSWHLVQFQGADDKVLKPDDPSKYSVEFNEDRTVSVRLDCNRGRGTWKSTAPPQLELTPLALSRAMCPQMTLHDQIATQWTFIRSYLIRDTHLFLSLMADAGIYEFEPTKAETP
jgi:para-nitrobenzyl esterase